MEWNCSGCNRKIISKEQDNFCLECWWKELVKKTEITPETISVFMEKNWLSMLSFRKESYSDILWIGSEDTKTLTSRRQKTELDSCYYPRTKKNMNIRTGFHSDAFLSEYNAFLEKLFHFAREEKIKGIRSNWRTEKNSDNETSFKVDNIIIEKKTTEELEKEE